MGDVAAPTRQPYIKKVVIHGFKTYGPHSDIEEFDPGMNVIVGLNGAGKSNFLAAICFVLGSDSFHKMSSEERKKNLHRGLTDTVIAGYVELHMDNMGDNIALGLPSEVVVRRTIGMKKDEYLLNNKRAELNDVINLFETIGFSRSNPYNIVLQGQVDALTAMSASERLELVKDIAGASLYDDKKTESLKLLAETEEKMKKVDEVIASLQSRLSALQSEKEELTTYQKEDKKRRALEHRIREMEMTQVERKLSALEDEHVQLTSQSADSYALVSELEDEVAALEAAVRDEEAEAQRLETLKRDLQRAVSEHIRHAGDLELNLGDARAGQGPDAAQVGEELAQVTQKVKSLEMDAARVSALFETSHQSEMQAKAALEAQEQQLKELQDKQGRAGRFKTKRERDEFLKTELTQLGQAKEARRKHSRLLDGEMAQLRTEMTRLEEMVAHRSETHATLMQNLKTRAEAWEVAKKKRDDFADVRKETWRKQKEDEERLFKLKGDLAHYHKLLHSSLPRELVLGLEEISKLKVPPHMKVYGPLVDLINLEDLYLTPVEVTAGISLFHVVVDTDETAAWVLTELSHARTGRVTCIPLNKLTPKELSDEVVAALGEKGIPLLKMVNPTDVVFMPAIKQLFGRMVLCPNLEVAKQLSHELRVACVTLDGDQVNVKGAMTGGFVDTKSSRLRNAFKIRKLLADFQAVEAAISASSTMSAQQEERVTRAIKEATECERLRNEALYAFETFADSSRASQRELFTAKETLAKRQRIYDENEAAVTSLEASIASLDKERQSEPIQALSGAELQRLQQLTIDVDKLAIDAATKTTSRADIEAQKSDVDMRLNSLTTRLVDLESQKASIDMKRYTAKTSQTFEELENQLVSVKEDLAAAEQSVKETDAQLAQSRETHVARAGERDEKKQEFHNAQLEVQQIGQALEKLFSSRSNTLSKKEELLKRIREIGSLPSEQTEAVSHLSLSECQRELTKAKDKLSEYSNINKKALDQFMSFTDEEQKFTERRDKMKEEYEAIHSLIESLDLQKDEAIARTFRGVAKNFSTVFKEICPDGEASLVMRVGKASMQSSSPDDDAGDSDEENYDDKGADERRRAKQREKAAQRATEQYIGIDMRVSFNRITSGFKEGAAIRQLSGGQRTITSLSLIFAIQRCDPAPFYIFDEIDPALDDRYRNTIAAMVRQQANKTQFLIVTHRPEMVRQAHKNYVVHYENRASVVEVVEVESALEVVAKAEKEAEKQTETNIRANQTGRKKRAPADKTLESPAKPTPKKSSSAAPASRSAAEEDDSDDDELALRFDRREADDEPMPFVLPEEHDIVEPPKSRTKRPRSMAGDS